MIVKIKITTMKMKTIVKRMIAMMKMGVIINYCGVKKVGDGW